MVDLPESGSNRRIAAAVVLVLLVAVAVVLFPPVGGGGDGGPNAGDGGATGDPTADGAPDVAVEDTPPGINETTLLDDGELVSAHRAAMARSGFAYEFAHRRTYNDSTADDIDVSGEVRATANLSTVEERIDRREPTDERVLTWTNGTAGARRTVANGTTNEEYPYSYGPRVTLHHVVENYLSFGEWAVDAVRETDDGHRFVLVASGVDRTDAGVEWNDELLNYSARMVVDEAGRIHRFRANFTTTEPAGSETDRRVRITRTLVYEVTAVGNVSVPPPEWLDDVREESDEE